MPRRCKLAFDLCRTWCTRRTVLIFRIPKITPRICTQRSPESPHRHLPELNCETYFTRSPGDCEAKAEGTLNFRPTWDSTHGVQAYLFSCTAGETWTTACQPAIKPSVIAGYYGDEHGLTSSCRVTGLCFVGPCLPAHGVHCQEAKLLLRERELHLLLVH